VKRFARAEDGSSIAELALVVPVLLLILFGIVEGSRVLNAWMILTNETREAARWAVAGARDGDSSLASEVQTTIQNDLSSILSGSPTVTVTTTSDGIMTTSVTVSASYSVPMVTPFTQAALGASVPIHVASTLRAE
jgi:Flp pilus assembly protein TadG